MKEPVQKVAYRLPELINMFGISKPSVYRWISDGQFPKPVKVGRLSLWPASTIDEWWRSKQEQ
jgi:prophage regulatory protein